jgi:glycosyltransferase involved in cell wall biosynthesis
MMKICYDYKIFSTQKYGGISRYFVELASRINQYPGARVRVVAPIYRSKFLASGTRAIPVLGMYTGLWGTRRLGCKLDAAFSVAFSTVYKPDIVHETYYSRHRTSSASAKTVITVHDTIEELFPEYFPLSQQTIEIRKAVYRRVDHIICISENTRRDLLRLYEIDPENVSVVYHGSSLAPPAQPSIRNTEPFVFYVGERAGYKNFLGLVAAFAQSQMFKTHQLVCFGGGPLRADEYERMDKLGVPRDRVVAVTGDDAKLASFYATAEAFVYPSIYEGFGIPLLEAMECGCPVVCGNTSSMPEVAGDAAIYFNARDTQEIAAALQKIVSSPEERLLLISKGKERVKQFSWDICAQRTYSVYEKLLAKY